MTRRIYLCAGLYAEGSSDYSFLGRLLNRLIDETAATLFAGNYEVADTLGIDAPDGDRLSRAERIAKAAAIHADAIELLVIHSDGGGDPARARATCVDPGIAAVHAACAPRRIPVVACIPNREIEAWMLTDPAAYQAALGPGMTLTLPVDPERVGDPKATLKDLLKQGGTRRQSDSIYALFGERRFRIVAWTNSLSTL